MVAGQFERIRNSNGTEIAKYHALPEKPWDVLIEWKIEEATSFIETHYDTPDWKHGKSGKWVKTQDALEQGIVHWIFSLIFSKTLHW